jgi:hypothetical protein
MRLVGKRRLPCRRARDAGDSLGHRSPQIRRRDRACPILEPKGGKEARQAARCPVPERSEGLRAGAPNEPQLLHLTCETQDHLRLTF